MALSPLTLHLLTGCIAAAILGDDTIAYALLIASLLFEFVVAPALDRD